jgi:hypothetical protein
MRRMLPALAALLALQLAVAGLLAMRSDPLRADVPDQPLVRAPVASADHLVIESKSEGKSGSTSGVGEAGETTRVELSRHGREWTIDNYFNAPATGSRIEAMLGRLAGLKRGLPVATGAADLRRFRVADEDYARRLTLAQGAKTLGTVYFGTSAGARSVDARSGEDRVVYNVDYATYEIPVMPGDWFDGDLLARPSAALHSIEIDYPDHRVLQLERAPNKDKQDGAPSGWQLAAPQPGQAVPDHAVPGQALPGQALDAAHAEQLAHALEALHVDAIMGTDEKPEWNQAHPMMAWKLTGADSKTETWTLSKPDGNNDLRVLKSSAHPWYFLLNSSTATSLLTASGREQLLPPTKSAH